jgi:hypothetical protein
MSKLNIATLCVLAALTAATPALATIYTITIPGQITSQISGSAPGINVGDPLTMTTTFDDSHYVVWGDNGYNVMGAYGLPSAGDTFWRIDGLGESWAAVLDLYDGRSNLVYRDAAGKKLAGPIIVFTDTEVLSVFGNPLVSYSDPTQLSLVLPTSGLSDPFPEDPPQFIPLPMLNTFIVNQPWIVFNDRFSYRGAWDFAAATVTITGGPIAGVPEPSVWTTLIVGFGLVGAMIRRRNRVANYPF